MKGRKSKDKREREGEVTSREKGEEDEGKAEVE